MLISLPYQVVTGLVSMTLDHVLDADHAEGCCSTCCPGCFAVHVMLSGGQLDRIAAPASQGGRAPWWDPGAGCVRRDLLTRTWRANSCHAPGARSRALTVDEAPAALAAAVREVGLQRALREDRPW